MKEIKPDEQYFLKLSTMTMPFGKYKGLRLVDLPELGEMLQAVYEIKLNGLEYLFKDSRDH